LADVNPKSSTRVSGMESTFNSDLADLITRC
jgi:hypothetical protein